VQSRFSDIKININININNNIKRGLFFAMTFFFLKQKKVLVQPDLYLTTVAPTPLKKVPFLSPLCGLQGVSKALSPS
jgi:hypothetical protein